MAYNSAYTGPQVDAAVGAVREKESAWDGKQNKLNGTEDQIVGFNAAGDAVPVAPPDTGVTTFNGRTGAVTPQEGDYTADMVGARPDTWTPSAADVGAVPTSRTVNGQELSQDINLTADNVGARPSTWTPTASDVGAIPNPSGGTTGQILEKTATGTQWTDKPASGIPIVTTSGTGSPYIATIPGITELTNGLTIILIPNVGEIGVPSLDLNELGSKRIKLAFSQHSDISPISPSMDGVSTLTANVPQQMFFSTVFDCWICAGQNINYQNLIDVVPDIRYTRNQVRGIALNISVPSSIPNGSIVGVYSK